MDQTYIYYNLISDLCFVTYVLFEPFNFAADSSTSEGIKWLYRQLIGVR